MSHQLQGTLSQKQSAKPVNFQKCPKSDHIYPPPTITLAQVTEMSRCERVFMALPFPAPLPAIHSSQSSRTIAVASYFWRKPPTHDPPCLHSTASRVDWTFNPGRVTEILHPGISMRIHSTKSFSVDHFAKRRCNKSQREMETKVCAKREKKR